MGGNSYLIGVLSITRGDYMFLLKYVLIVIAIIIVYMIKIKRNKGEELDKTTKVKTFLKTLGSFAILKVCIVILIIILLIIFYRP